MKARFYKFFSGILVAIYFSSMALTGAVFATPKQIGTEQFPAGIQEPQVGINPETGKVSVFAEKEVVDLVEDERTEVALQDALKVDPEAQPGSMVIVETTPRDFGRVDPSGRGVVGLSFWNSGNNP